MAAFLQYLVAENAANMPDSRRLTAFAIVASLVLATAATAVQRTWHPAIASFGPSTVVHGANVTVNGTDLDPSGWRRRLDFPRKYGTSHKQVTLPFCCSASQFTFAADKEMRGDSVRVDWFIADSALAVQNPVPANERSRFLNGEIVVQGAPILTMEGDPVAPDIGPSFKLMKQMNGSGIVKGMYLRAQSMPTVRLGNTTLNVLAHAYEPTGQLNTTSATGGSGADRVFFSLPTQKLSGWLVLDNSLGKDSAQVTFAFPPAPSQVVLQTATGTSPLAPANTLQRGRTYVIRGQNLSITHIVNNVTSVKRGQARLGTTDIAPSFASDTNIVFTIPASFSATSAALSAVTQVGTATIGTFNIVNPVAAIDVLSLTPPLTTVTTGKAFLLYANLGIPQGVKEFGNLLVSAPGAAPGTLKLKAVVPVTGASTELKFEGGDLQQTTPVTVLVAHESNGVNGVTTQTKQVTFSLRPPHPTHISGPATVTAGTSQTFNVDMDSSVTGTSAIFALLSSSNPNILAVPANATVNAKGAEFTATVLPAAQAGGTATITATLDGASASLPVTVQLPTVQQLSLLRDRFSDVIASALPGALVTAQVTLNGKLASGQGVSISTSDTTLDHQNTQWDGMDATGLKFNKVFRVSTGLSQQRQATITATYGGVSRTATITLNPMVISSFTATPASGTGGTTISATVLLSSPAGSFTDVTFASADTTRATVSPASANISSGSTSKVMSIVLKGPVSTPRQVPITATLRVGTASSPPVIVSTLTVVVTVNP